MKTARELAQQIGLDIAADFRFLAVVEVVATAIEARDASWSAALTVAREALAWVRRQAASPMRAWETGDVIDAH